MGSVTESALRYSVSGQPRIRGLAAPVPNQCGTGRVQVGCWRLGPTALLGLGFVLFGSQVPIFLEWLDWLLIESPGELSQGRLPAYITRIHGAYEPPAIWLGLVIVTIAVSLFLRFRLKLVLRSFLSLMSYLVFLMLAVLELRSVQIVVEAKDYILVPLLLGGTIFLTFKSKDWPIQENQLTIDVPDRPLAS